MRSPVVAVVGNLIWSRTGRVWAIWRVRETPYAWLPARRKLAAHAAVRTLLARLPGDAMVLSVAARIDASEVVEAMTEGVDLDERVAWAEVVEATWDRLDELDIYRRRHYLVVELPETKTWWRGLARSASGSVRHGFGLSPPPLPASVVKAALAQATDLEAQLGAVRLDRPSAGEVRWLYARATRRGLADEPALAGWPEPRQGWIPRGDEMAVTTPTLVPLLDANYKEGGYAEDPGRPLHRRYLRVESDEGVSYQSFSLVADAPQQFSFPGGLSEWLFMADQLPFPVDWCCRIKVVPNQDARRSATRQQRELLGQFDQYEGEPAGAPESLDDALDAVRDQQRALAANPGDPELQVAMIYATWADDLALLERRNKVLSRVYQGAEYHLHRPTGDQERLFEALLPGAPAPRVCQDYRQHLLPAGLAAGMPFAGAALGDAGGLLLGQSTDTGCARPVLVDPAAGPRHNRDGSAGFFGVQGTGKSYAAKRHGATTVLRGGQVVAVDRTPAGEYVRFATGLKLMGVRTQVVTVGEHGGLLLDPLRLFAGPFAVQAAVGYLGTICGVDPTGLEGMTLTKAVQAVADRGGRLADVLPELEGLAGLGPEHRHARELAMRLEGLSTNRFGRPVWGGEGGPTLDASADLIVVHMPNLALPSREVLLSEHLSRKLLGEQVCSLGLLYLVAALAQDVIFRDRSRFAALLLDEVWALIASLHGEQLIEQIFRDARKHNAAAWVMSQDPADVPDKLRNLISSRFLFGLNGEAARLGLRWLGVDATAANVDMVESWAARAETDPTPRRAPGDGSAADDPGAPPDCLMRDPHGRVGRVQLVPAETELLRAAFESNPIKTDPLGTGTADGPTGPEPPDTGASTAA